MISCRKKMKGKIVKLCVMMSEWREGKWKLLFYCFVVVIVVVDCQSKREGGGELIRMLRSCKIIIFTLLFLLV